MLTRIFHKNGESARRSDLGREQVGLATKTTAVPAVSQPAEIRMPKFRRVPPDTMSESDGRNWDQEHFRLPLALCPLSRPDGTMQGAATDVDLE